MLPASSGLIRHIAERDRVGAGLSVAAGGGRRSLNENHDTGSEARVVNEGLCRPALGSRELVEDTLVGVVAEDAAGRPAVLLGDC